MINFKSIFAAALMAGGMVSAAPAPAAEEGGVSPEQQSWSFAGIFGTYDENQLQRGFQVFREVCSSCHSANLLAFRNLEEEGGPNYSDDQIKLLASQYTIEDPSAEGGERPAVLADHWPAPFASDQDAKDANGGVVPPDFSVLAKARGIEQPFPWWVFNYFTAYQESGPDFIYNVLVHFSDPPADVDVPAGKYYNAFLGTSINMPPPLSDGLVSYDDPNIPQTTEQYARDVSAFMMWMADPHLAARHEAGLRVMVFLILFAVLMYLVKRRLWQDVEH